MTHRLLLATLQVFLVLGILIILAAQVVVLPILAAEAAAALPDEAYMRWPILGLAIAGLVCVQVAMVCTLRLVGFIRQGRVFTTAALPWVDGIIGAFLAAAVVCAVTIGYQSVSVAGPPLWMMLLVVGTLAGVGLALLMWTMRTLLVQAVAQRADLDLVV